MHAVSSQSDLTIICYTQLKKSNKEAKKTSKEDRQKLEALPYKPMVPFHHCSGCSWLHVSAKPVHLVYWVLKWSFLFFQGSFLPALSCFKHKRHFWGKCIFIYSRKHDYKTVHTIKTQECQKCNTTKFKVLAVQVFSARLKINCQPLNINKKNSKQKQDVRINFNFRRC